MAAVLEASAAPPSFEPALAAVEVQAPALAAMAAVAMLTLSTLPALAALAAVDAVAVLTARWAIACAMIDRRHLRRLPMFDDRGLPSSGPSGLDPHHDVLDVRDAHVRAAHQVQLASHVTPAAFAAASLYANA